MAMKRVTMQDIANACGLSRNTVSKIFNGRGAVPEATRQTVLRKAQELGYHQIPEEEPVRAEPRSQNIALLTNRMPADYHFGTFFVPAFAGQLSRAGYTLMMYEIAPDELRGKTLPAHMSLEQTAGIMVIELFDREYLDMLCDLGVPTISIDAYYGANTSPMRCDIISMENTASTFALTNHIISSGARRLGFVGDVEHCNSFHERWTGFCLALCGAGLPLERELCILDSDDAPYGDPEWLLSRLQKMPVMPDAFVCANDYLALCTMTTLKRHGVLIPNEVMVAGFDGTPQSSIVEPALTTAWIPSNDIGRMAADMLLARIENPDRPFQSTYVKTTPLWRDSTARK